MVVGVRGTRAGLLIVEKDPRSEARDWYSSQECQPCLVEGGWVFQRSRRSAKTWLAAALRDARMGSGSLPPRMASRASSTSWRTKS